MMTHLEFPATHEELVTENHLLREHLANLLDQANCNQKIMQRLQMLDLQLIGASSLSEFVDILFNSLARTSELDVVTLSLIDPEGDIQRILMDLGFDTSLYPNLQFYERASDLGDLCSNLQMPLLGRYSSLRHRTLFPRHITLPRSVAVLPLLRHGKLIGCLSMGSRHESRFVPGMATDFVERMALVVAICLENVINNERLRHISLIDPLTGVTNRRYIDRRLHEEIARARRQNYMLSCMYIDIDFFKRINDTYGHQAGDNVLCEVAKLIKAELRLSDALGRFGGEEFVVLLINADLASAVQVAERIRASIANAALKINSRETIHATVSIGVTSLKAIEITDAIEPIALQLIAKADEGLYQAKETGRNKVVSIS